jgi:flagellar basal body-associated protein FliL
MWFSLAVNFIPSAIKEATKNKKKRAELRTRLMEVRDAIDALYAPED